MKIGLLAILISIFAMNLFATDNKSNATQTKQYIIDVRTQAEYDAGHIEGAILIPYDVIKDKIAQKVSDKSAKVILYCRSGRRSGIALNDLKSLGYTNAENYGGMEAAKSKLNKK